MKRITLKILGANLKRNTELLSQMDPYCICKLGNQSKKTQTKDEQGMNPMWGDILEFQPISQGDNLLKIQVWDANVLSDDLIGQGYLDIQQYLDIQYKTSLQVLNLRYNQIDAGQLNIEVSVNTFIVQ